jgi:hypothetical protein
LLIFRELICAGNKRKIITLEIVLPVMSSLLILTCIGLIWIYGFRGGYIVFVLIFMPSLVHKKLKRRFLTGNQGSSNVWKRLTRGDPNSSIELADKNTEFPILSFREIAAATNNFSESSILGQGGFGNVYKARIFCTSVLIIGLAMEYVTCFVHYYLFFQGTLEDGKEIAVKRLRVGSVQGLVEFKNEIAVIAKLQHKNLVKLLGCCIHEDEKLLIYEYLPNRSLDAFIFGMFCSLLAKSQQLLVT